MESPMDRNKEISVYRTAVEKAWEHTHKPLESELDYLARSTEVSNLWDGIYAREKRRSEEIEKLEAEVESLESASSSFSGKDYNTLRKLHYKKSLLREKKRDQEPVDECLEALCDVLASLEQLAEQKLGHVPHSFFEN